MDYTIDVVSPQFPCGAAWLANALLELQIPLRSLWGFDTKGEWDNTVPGISRYSATHLPWLQTLASLRIDRTFQFQDGHYPRFSHAFPWQLDLAKRIVLMVRDPRDALYSEWQRHLRNAKLAEPVDFCRFLTQPFVDGPISIVDMLWLHLQAWLQYRSQAPHQVHILRFEDWKRDPIAALRSVTQWAGILSSDPEIARAALASDVKELVAIESAIQQSDPSARRFNRGSSPQEWRTVWCDSWYTQMGAHWQVVLQILDYERLVKPGNLGLCFDPETVLRWRDLSDPAELQHWISKLFLHELESAQDRT